MSLDKTRDVWSREYPGLNGEALDFSGGWNTIVEGLLASLSRLDGWRHEFVVQIKEKYGGLRFSYDHTLFSGDKETADHLVALAEERSWKTCEECGTEDGVAQRNKPGKGAVRTLCGPCGVLK